MLETNVDGLLLLGVSMTYSSTVGNVDDNLDRGHDCLDEIVADTTTTTSTTSSHQH